MEFKERLYKLRKESHLTQSKLGNILNYRPTTISNYESGRNEPSISDIKKIANFFNVSVDYLLCVHDVRMPFGDNKLNPYLELIKSKFEKLSPENQDSIVKYVDYLLYLQKTEQETNSENSLKVAETIRPYKTNK